ncbi:uncharacterized protein TrAFT101_004004 [Trichoderma asperellum]|uniref:Uncharacterized protein n=1 Tax=Trichoderma asperellum (strain ATCC 204424 / CBS 433.97 / NBRC 101777) TaxID=1042311 RepID=A0A2T3ZP33_TRIA4|nr:hypothetical protein M441DRAFT_53272 [Trichoderma asperellum CBS 433.97]PTB46544.1 hypothetical protein M441DRAFT_53272 [Trichoderma asperellum CBS 433.97]UKZ88242.1 hypothetical protein TrAFT101_004004 [Trichoderma asperellum]
MDQAASDISTCSTDDCPTPTSTIMTDTMFADKKDIVVPIAAAPHVEHHLVANRSFMIRTRQKPHLYLTLEHGELKLLENITVGGGWLWYCFKNCGWYGFRNTVSGTYLGHAWWDDRHRLLANAPHHRADEYFIADRQTDGGYTLLARKDDQLLPVVISEFHMLLGQAEEANGTAWEFVDTKFINMQVLLKHL